MISRNFVDELRLRGEIHRLQYHAVRVRSVACKTAHDPAGPKVTHAQRCAGSDRHAASHDGICTKVPDAEISNVHAAAAALAVAVFLPEELGNRPEQVVFQSFVE